MIIGYIFESEIESKFSEDLKKILLSTELCGKLHYDVKILKAKCFSNLDQQELASLSDKESCNDKKCKQGMVLETVRE